MSDSRSNLSPQASHSDNDFLSACGGENLPRLWIEVGDERFWEARFSRPDLIIGQSPQADIQLEHPSISFRHIYLQWLNGHLACFDLSSRTGIRRELGKDASKWLEPQEAFGIGPYTILSSFCRAETRPDELGKARSPIVLETLFPKLEAEAKWLRLNRWILLAGWSNNCHLRLQHPSVSRIHAAFVLTPTGQWVIDLLGNQPVLVNRQAIRSAQLRDQDELEIGQFHFRVHDTRIRTRLSSKAVANSSRSTVPFPKGSGLIAPSRASARPPRRIIQRAPQESSSNDLPPQNPDTQRREHHADEIPAHAEEHARSGHDSDVASVIHALTSQFAQLQQDMFAQNQQILTMFGQLMDQVHREQHDFVRAELQQIQTISHELLEVRSRLNRATPPPETAHEDEAPSSPVNLPDTTTRQSLEHEEPTVDRPDDVVSDADQTSDPSAEPAVTDKVSAENLPNKQLAEEATSKSRDSSQQHILLTQRLHALEKERNSRWKRLLSTLTGKQHPPA